MATSEQFIVDNAAEDWKALQYVREWCDISSAIDIATGHFEIGAFLALDGAWQGQPTELFADGYADDEQYQFFIGDG